MPALRRPRISARGMKAATGAPMAALRAPLANGAELGCRIVADPSAGKQLSPRLESRKKRSRAGRLILTIYPLPSHRPRLDDEVNGRSPGSRVLAFALLPRASAPVA